MNSDTKRIKQLRKNIFLTAYAGGIGHLASAFSVVEILYALYLKGILRYDPQNPEWVGRDRFIMSKGHGSLALYVVMCMAGFFEEKELMTFSRPGTRLGGEPNMLELPGIEASTGSLGHGLSLGVGMALADRIDERSNKTYVLLGDGECQEGSVWEAVMSAAGLGLDNLTVILDSNRIQKMGFVKDIMGITSWNDRWHAFGWHVDEVDGHDLDAVCKCLVMQGGKGKPRIVIAHTIKGKDVSIMENSPGWHWRLPTKKEMKTVLRELDISEEELKKCRKPI